MSYKIVMVKKQFVVHVVSPQSGIKRFLKLFGRLYECEFRETCECYYRRKYHRNKSRSRNEKSEKCNLFRIIS